MEPPDIIVKGIHDLGELQGEKRTILEKIQTTKDHSIDIDDIVKKIPSYVDKCDYLKMVLYKFINQASESSSRANDIVALVSDMKNYIDTSNLDSCKNGKSIKQRLLKDLQTIQDDAYFIVRPGSKEGDSGQYSFAEEPIIPQESNVPRGGKKRRTRNNKTSKYTNKYTNKYTKSSRRSRRRSKSRR